MASHEQPGKNLLARNSILNLFGQILPMLVGVLTIPYIIRGLGTDGYGILSIAWMTLGYFSIFDLGLSRATTKFVAEHLHPDKVDKVPELVWTSLTLLVVSGCVFGALVGMFVPVAVTHFFRMPASFIGQARTSLFLLAASMPIILGNDALRGVLEAAQRFDLVNYVKVPASVCFYLLAAMAIVLGIGVPGIVCLLVLVRLISALAYLLLCFRVFPGLRTKIVFSRAAIRPLATFGGWVMITNFAGPIFGYLERFLIASVLSVGFLTFYSAPFDLVSKAIIFPASIAPALFPYFSYHGGRNGDEVSDVTSRTVKYLLLVMTPITAVFVFFGREILQLWLGSQFANQSTVVLQLLALSFFLNAFAFVPYTSVQALGRPELKAILDTVALPIYALYCWWLMRRMGINGAALAKLVSTIIDTGFLFAFAWKMKAFSIRDCVSGPLSRTLMTSGCLLFTVFLIESLHARLLVSVLLLIICFACYVVTFWHVSVDREERETLRGLSQLLLARR
jgi:O-antigen/teichoic acid export membrane protein